MILMCIHMQLGNGCRSPSLFSITTRVPAPVASSSGRRSSSCSRVLGVQPALVGCGRRSTLLSATGSTIKVDTAHFVGLLLRQRRRRRSGGRRCSLFAGRRRCGPGQVSTGDARQQRRQRRATSDISLVKRVLARRFTEQTSDQKAQNKKISPLFLVSRVSKMLTRHVYAAQKKEKKLHKTCRERWDSRLQSGIRFLHWAEWPKTSRHDGDT